jgi:hypothetical protein
VRDVIGQALRDAGWQVIEASTAEDAIALTRTGHPYIDHNSQADCVVGM